MFYANIVIKPNRMPNLDTAKTELKPNRIHFFNFYTSNIGFKPNRVEHIFFINCNLRIVHLSHISHARWTLDDRKKVSACAEAVKTYLIKPFYWSKQSDLAYGYLLVLVSYPWSLFWLFLVDTFYVNSISQSYIKFSYDNMLKCILLLLEAKFFGFKWLSTPKSCAC